VASRLALDSFAKPYIYTTMFSSDGSSIASCTYVWLRNRKAAVYGLCAVSIRQPDWEFAQPFGPRPGFVRHLSALRRSTTGGGKFPLGITQGAVNGTLIGGRNDMDPHFRLMGAACWRWRL